MSEQEIAEGLHFITYGLYIVTSSWQGRDNGMIVNTVFQVTAQPARVAISVNKESLSHELISHSRVFAAMPLEQQTPLPFIGIFGFRTGRTFDKLAKVPHKTGFLGCPIVTEHTLSYMEIEVCQTLDVGSHTLFVGEVKDAGVIKPQGTALTYAYYHDVIKGKTPAGATHL